MRPYAFQRIIYLTACEAKRARGETEKGAMPVHSLKESVCSDVAMPDYFAPCLDKMKRLMYITARCKLHQLSNEDW